MTLKKSVQMIIRSAEKNKAGMAERKCWRWGAVILNGVIRVVSLRR